MQAHQKGFAALFVYVWLFFTNVAVASRVSVTAREKRYNVMDYGAIGDGSTLDTVAIKKTIDAVAKAGTGTIYFPRDKVFLTGPFNLTSHCTVYVERNTTILASTNKDDYMRIPALPSYGQGKKGGPTRRISLLHGQNLTDVVVTGDNGTIDGNGAAWWYHKKKNDTPPHLIEFMYSDTIEVSHLTLTNSAFWTVHPVYSKAFLAHHLLIVNPSNVSNTDGIDPDSTHDVLIHNVYIDVGDDGIAIKSGWNEYGYQLNHSSMNITIRDCAITTPCAAVSIGSEMSGGVKDVHISNCHLFNTTAGLHIKSGIGRGGYVHNVHVEETRIENAYYAIMVDTDSDSRPADSPGHHYDPTAIPDMRNISANRIKGEGITVVAKLIGLKEDPLGEIKLTDVHLDNNAKYECSNVSGTYKNVVPKPCSNLSPVDQTN